MMGQGRAGDIRANANIVIEKEFTLSAFASTKQNSYGLKGAGVVKIVLAGDHAGFVLKESLRRDLEERGEKVFDLGVFDEESADYPDLALSASQAVRSGEFDRAILVCGTGIGVSITANKVQGIRAALCGDCFSARCAREHNDANVLALGARVVGPGLALEIVRAFLETPFAGGRHQRRIEKIQAAEQQEKNCLETLED